MATKTDDFSVAHAYSSALLNSGLFDLRTKGFETVRPLIEEAIAVSRPVVAAIETKKHDRAEDAFTHFYARISLCRKLYDFGQRKAAVAEAIEVVGQFHEYVDQYPESAQLQTKGAQLFNYLGILHAKNGQIVLAAKQYELTCEYSRRALAIKPNDDGQEKVGQEKVSRARKGVRQEKVSSTVLVF